MEQPKMSIPCARRCGIVMLVALLAFAGCNAATHNDISDASPTATVASPTEMPPGTTPPTTAPSRPAEEASVGLRCKNPADLTPATTEGPYFKPGSPERQSMLEDGMAGTRLILTGYVLTQDCQPIPQALLDFWQADASGVYDNTGYRLRGHQFADETGRYLLQTVVPDQYGGRTPHIHVKVQAPTGPMLTSQLYFPGEPANSTDSIFSPELLVAVEKSKDEIEATFDFIVEIGR